MEAIKVANLSRKSSDIYGSNGFRVAKLGNVGGVYDFSVRSDYDDVEDEIVLSPPQKRMKLCYVDDHDSEPGQLDEEDFSHARNILTSRWAYDDDMDDCGNGNVIEGKKCKGTSSSPESGVTQKDGSDVSDGGYDNGDECLRRDLVDEDGMDVDLSDGEGSFGGGLYYGDDEKNVLEAGVGESRNRDMLQGCRSVFEYEKLGKISEGSYGIVYKAREKKTGEIVALKKLKLAKDSEGFPVHYLREINILLALNHPSVVNVREVVVDDSADGFDNIYMVMDYMEHDLKALMQARKQPFTVSEVKCLMLQLLEGMKYLHDNWVIHRDLKTSNLLFNNKGELKLCDFGMSRQYGSLLNPYTALVVTLWYRAPELLLGAKEYSSAVDMWSIGCIMAEMLTSKPLFDGKTEMEQLNKIFKILGTPNDKIWPSYSKLPGGKANFAHQPHNLLHKKFPCASFTGSPTLSDLGLDLLSKLLTYDPEKRITVDQALNHRWFQEAPLPMPKDYMPTFPAEKAALTR